MPYSSDEGKEWMLRRLVELAPGVVLDVGAGWGTYARLVRPYLPDAVLMAVEVHEPYVERFGLQELYDLVLVADVRTLPLPLCDVAILGDVLEHLPRSDAVAVWEKVRRTAATTLLSLPIVKYPQGTSEGNPHEAHLHTWDHEQVMALGGITSYRLGKQIGVYEACGLGAT